MGIAFETEGATRIMGRIFGLLLLSERPIALIEIAAALGVSRASVSTDARRLLQLGLLERRAHAGDRRDFYAVHPDGFRSSLEARIANLRSFADLVGEARTLGGGRGEIEQRVVLWERAHQSLLASFERLLSEYSSKS